MFHELEYSLLPNLMHILNIRTYPTAPKKKTTQWNIVILNVTWTYLAVTVIGVYVEAKYVGW